MVSVPSDPDGQEAIDDRDSMMPERLSSFDDPVTLAATAQTIRAGLARTATRDLIADAESERELER